MRILVPVVVIHAVGFAGLYWTTYRLTIDEIHESHRFQTGLVLDEVQATFEQSMKSHAAPDLGETLAELSRAHRWVDVAVYDAVGHLVATSGAAQNPEREAAIQGGQRPSAPGTSWFTGKNDPNILTGVRRLQNDEECQHCHPQPSRALGSIVMSVDLKEPLQGAKARLTLHLGVLVLVWAALMFAMSRIKDWVIGRPLARIGESLNAVANTGGDPTRADLDTLASKLNTTLWQLIEGQKTMEAGMARNMLRAEQLASVGELAAGLTHEIKNPIAGVTAAIQVLRADESDKASERTQVYNQVLHELERVTGTLDSFLRLARPQPARRTSVNLELVGRNVVALFKPRLRGRNVEIEVEVAGQLPAMQVDPHLITQLLLNLLTNSAQAVADGGLVKLFLSPFPHGDGVVLCVTDNGSGIPPQNLERIFEPFFTTKEDGTGLGLAICRQIVSQHGGTISIESEPGKGTRVVVLLPDLSQRDRRDLHGTDTRR